MHTPSQPLHIIFSANKPYTNKNDFTFSPNNPTVCQPESIIFTFAEGSKHLKFADFLSDHPEQFGKVELSDHDTVMTVSDRDTNTIVEKICYRLVFNDENGNPHTTPDPQIINNPT